MMKTHLDTTLNEALANLHQDYPADVAAYDAVHAHILMMADALSAGIISEFPDRFGPAPVPGMPRTGASPAGGWAFGLLFLAGTGVRPRGLGAPPHEGLRGRHGPGCGRPGMPLNEPPDVGRRHK